MALPLGGCCSNFCRRDSTPYNEMDAEQSTVQGLSWHQRPVLLFRCLGVCQLGLGVGLLVCGLIIGILGKDGYSWGGLLIGLLEVVCGVLCLLATCRNGQMEEMAYRRFASGQLRIHFWISVSILIAFGLSGILTTGFGGLGTCDRMDDESDQLVKSSQDAFIYELVTNRTSNFYAQDIRSDIRSAVPPNDVCNIVRNASIVVIVFMLLSVIAAILFIILLCVFGEQFGLDKSSLYYCECCRSMIANVQNARRANAYIAQEMRRETQMYGRHLNARDVIAQQQELQRFQQQQQDNRDNICENDPHLRHQRQQLQNLHDRINHQHHQESDGGYGQQDGGHSRCVTSPVNQTTYDVVRHVNSGVVTLMSLIDDAQEQMVVVDRHNIVDDILNLYTDPEILWTRIKVQFKDEQGDDFGGLTKDMFTQFWKKAKDVCFTGCDTMVPRLPMHWDPNIIMAAMGRVISHMLMLRGRVPYAFCRCSILAACAPDAVISQGLLLEDFLLYSEADVKAILRKVTDNPDELTDDDLDKLIDLFEKHGQQVMPRRDIIREQIATVAKAEFCNKPMYLLRPMRIGLGMSGRLADFWDNMNEENIRVLFAHKIPTADDVIACLRTHRRLRNREQFSLDLLKMFLKDTESTLLTPFLTIVTGSADLPDEGINVTFNNTSGAGRRPCFHTCGNVLELSMNYPDYDEFKREMEAVLTNPDYLEMGLR